MEISTWKTPPKYKDGEKNYSSAFKKSNKIKIASRSVENALIEYHDFGHGVGTNPRGSLRIPRGKPPKKYFANRTSFFLSKKSNGFKIVRRSSENGGPKTPRLYRGGGPPHHLDSLSMRIMRRLTYVLLKKSGLSVFQDK